MSGGLFIVLEGLDGAGTTTQTTRLVASLVERGLDAHATREPSTGPVGRLLREMLSGQHQPVDQATLGLLFAADRADHLQREIEPALARGAIVVSDRYYHSSLAYQGDGEAFAWVERLNEQARRPDVTYFLEVDVDVAAARRAAAGRPEELFDRLETQRRVAAGYQLAIARLRDRETIEVLDGHRGLDELAADLLQRVLRRKHRGPEE
jgi:dTMP kinase